MNTLKPAVFLDRDDTLIRNIPYLGDPSKVELLQGTVEALTLLENAGFALIIISNQSGVGRGLITKDQVSAVTSEMIRQLGKNFFAGIYNSYAAPEEKAIDRKPSPYLVQLAAKEHSLDLTKSYFVGDRWSDIECGINAGIATVLVSSGTHGEDMSLAREKASVVVHGLLEAACWIISARA